MLNARTGQKMKRKKTRFLSGTSQPEFNETLTFDVTYNQLDIVQFLVVLCSKVRIAIKQILRAASINGDALIHLIFVELGFRDSYDQRGASERQRRLGFFGLQDQGCSYRQSRPRKGSQRLNGEVALVFRASQPPETRHRVARVEVTFFARMRIRLQTQTLQEEFSTLR